MDSAADSIDKTKYAAILDVETHVVIKTAYRKPPTHVETKTDRGVPQNIIIFNISFKKHSTYLDH